MGLICKLQKCLRIIYTKTNKSLFDKSYEEQFILLNGIRNPISLTERSYFQYKCQMNRINTLLKAVQNFGAIFLLIYYFIKPFNQARTHNSNNKIKIAIFLREGITIDTIPVSVQNEFDKIYEYPLKGSWFLSKDDKKFIFDNCIMKYWYSPFFCLKCTVKVAIYSNLIFLNQPNAIITHNEYSFTSSFLTEFCRFYKVQHINVMHGEKIFDIHDSFVEFDRYYVWDQHYVDLMISLRANSEQFKIEIPRSVQLEIDNYCKYEKELTYYLGGETKKDLINLRINLLNTKIPIERICLRYHPRYGDKQQISRMFSGFQIENPIEVSLSKSISKTRYVASLYSTVLYQAFVNGKEIIIDDISNREKYKKLQNLKYIMIDKPHLLLSDMIKEN